MKKRILNVRGLLVALSVLIMFVIVLFAALPNVTACTATPTPTPTHTCRPTATPKLVTTPEASTLVLAPLPLIAIALYGVYAKRKQTIKA
jgi:hypothetical protein